MQDAGHDPRLATHGTDHRTGGPVSEAAPEGDLLTETLCGCRIYEGGAIDCDMHRRAMSGPLPLTGPGTGGEPAEPTRRQRRAQREARTDLGHIWWRGVTAAVRRPGWSRIRIGMRP